jgi:NAD(P)-dependent dehydrogenase (short-subunit alcohol dehydrogenase family)
VIAYPAMLDVPAELVGYVANLLRAERRRRGTRKGTRLATCRRQAVFVLTWFRKKDDIAVLGAGFGLSRATAYRYHAEGLKVLAAQAPDLAEALQQVKDDGWAYVILDGTIIAADRDAAKTTSVKGKPIDLWYSGKTRHPGGNLQALMRPDGIPVWISGVEPGSVHDLTAARAHVLPTLYAAAAAGLPTLADGGYAGAGIGVHIPIKQPGGNQVLDADNRTYNALLRGLRAPGERGFALLKTRWKALQHVTACPRMIDTIAKAALVLTLFEHKLIPC